MPNKNLYIVDNDNADRTVTRYLKEWCAISKQMDIATGYFEIGGLLELDGEWQKLDKVRIILGSEVTRRTKDMFDVAIQSFLHHFDYSIEAEKEQNDFLLGVPAILSALKSGKIECRVFDKSKFHAKAYITYFRDDFYSNFISSMNVPDGYALVGSSNFTKAGLTRNIELNVQVKNEVTDLQEWFNKHWEEAVDITEAILTTTEKHCREYSPFDVYLKSLFEYYQHSAKTVSQWERDESKIYPLLAQYQRDGYNALIQITNKYFGAFLCDGVGLGKTFVGLMLIERFVKKERKNVVLIVPASARVSVWEITIKKYLPEMFDGFFSFKIINHTDLLLEKNQYLMDKIAEQAEVVVIDEAHHFRNRASGRYRKLFDMLGQGCQKQLFMLTATPINNSFLDLQHLIELFTQRREDYFRDAPLGIHTIPGHFRKMEAKLEELSHASLIDASDGIDYTDAIFREDALVNALIVQRSRAYVKKSLTAEEGARVLFPVRKPPSVVNYSLAKTYGRLIGDFIYSFYRKDKKTGQSKPILALAVYSPYEDAYYIGDKSKIDQMKAGRQMQVVNLMRQLLLKRFESSVAAFEETCIRIFARLRKFSDDYRTYGNEREIERFFIRHERELTYIEERLAENADITIEMLEDDLPEYVWEAEEVLNVDDFDIPLMLEETINDLDILFSFISDMMDIDPSNDDKINELKHLLACDTRLMDKKIIIFSEYRATAKYIYRQLASSGFHNIFEIDGQTKLNRHDVITRFAPYYNDSSSCDIDNEIQILIATDVLAEGLNLQDATCLINYELHWNPVRLMQRIGRVDRRRNAEIEQRLLHDHPEMVNERGNVYYWNFLPPDELENLLSLYRTVSQKALRISKTFGIEGKQLLTPEDNFEALKDFNAAYEGSESRDEEMALEYQMLLENNPEYTGIVEMFPKKMFSGRTGTLHKGFFFCYELPTKRTDGSWSEGDGLYRWYLLDTTTDVIYENVYEIWKAIKTEPSESRIMSVTDADFVTVRKKIETYITRTYMRSVQAPVGKKARLVTWLQLC